MIQKKVPTKAPGLSNKAKLSIIIIIAFLARIWLVYWMPLVKDEILYAENIHSMIDSPSLTLLFLGQEVAWKPPLFFLVYAPFVALLQYIPIGFEAAYRLPTVLFSLVNILLVYRLIRNVSGDESTAFFTSLIFSLIFLTVYVDSTALIDTFNLALILGALCIYTDKAAGSWMLLAAGALTLMAFFTKLWVAVLIPVLAISWQVSRKKGLSDPYLLASLLAIPVAALIYFMTFSGPMAQDTSLVQVLSDRVLMLGLSANQLLGSVHAFFMTANIWVGVGLFGFFRFWKENPIMSAWAVVSLVPLIAGYYMPWYSLPTMVPLAYFSCMLLLRFDGSAKADTFFVIVLSLLLLSGYIFGFLLWEQPRYDDNIASKEAGMLLASKDNVIVIGDWDPTIAGYKFLQERRNNGHYNDFGWIVFGNSTLPSQVRLQSFSDNYLAEDIKFENDFMCIFINPPGIECNYRKISNVTEAEYVGVVGFSNQSLVGFDLIYNKSNIRIFRISNQR